MMTTQLVLRFNNADDLIRVLVFLKEQGLEDLAFPSHDSKIKDSQPPVLKKWEGLGSVDLAGKLSAIPNLRDFAYED
jgi:hypothetical protein